MNCLNNSDGTKSNLSIGPQGYMNLYLEHGLRLEPDLNIFIGPNGSGKSHACELVKEYKWSRNKRFYDFGEVNVQPLKDAVYGKRPSKILDANCLYLDANCLNMVDVLHSLSRQFQGYLKQLTHSLKGIIHGLVSIRKTLIGEQRRGIKFIIEGGRELQTCNLSNGELRLLCLAIILNNPCPPSLLVLENPEVGIHVELYGLSC